MSDYRGLSWNGNDKPPSFAGFRSNSIFLSNLYCQRESLEPFRSRSIRSEARLSNSLRSFRGGQDREEAQENVSRINIIPVAEKVEVRHTDPENFNELRGVLIALWKGQWSRKDLTALTKIEEDILKLIIARKAPGEDLEKNFAKRVQELSQQCFKRQEEKLKFVVKCVVKKMLDNYHRPEKGSRRSGKISNHRNFFDKHFHKIARDMGADIELFMLPGTIKHPHNFKIIGSEYLMMLKKSPSFVKDFMGAMQAFKDKGALETTKSKLEKFVKKLEESYFKERNFESIKKILKEKKSKIPWTKAEVDDACKIVGEILLD